MRSKRLPNENSLPETNMHFLGQFVSFGEVTNFHGTTMDLKNFSRKNHAQLQWILPCYTMEVDVLPAYQPEWRPAKSLPTSLRSDQQSPRLARWWTSWCSWCTCLFCQGDKKRNANKKKQIFKKKRSIANINYSDNILIPLLYTCNFGRESLKRTYLQQYSSVLPTRFWRLQIPSPTFRFDWSSAWAWHMKANHKKILDRLSPNLGRLAGQNCTENHQLGTFA